MGDPTPNGPLLAGAVESGADEPWTLLAKPTVLCFVREEGRAYSSRSTLYLGVETAVVAVPVLLGASGTVQQELSWLGTCRQTRMQQIVVVSRSDEPIQLSAEPLDELGPFAHPMRCPRCRRASVEIACASHPATAARPRDAAPARPAQPRPSRSCSALRASLRRWSARPVAEPPPSA